MLARMKRLVFAALCRCRLAGRAGASNFTLVNGTGAALAELSIRRAGTQEWKTLGTAPSAGARIAMKFSDPDCAFDIHANVPGAGPVTWAGVNLCAVKSVTLNRDGRQARGSITTSDACAAAAARDRDLRRPPAAPASPNRAACRRR